MPNPSKSHYGYLAPGRYQMWAGRKKEKFDEKPPYKWNDLDPIRPTLEVINFDKYMRIRYAKRRAA